MRFLLALFLGLSAKFDFLFTTDARQSSLSSCPSIDAGGMPGLHLAVPAGGQCCYFENRPFPALHRTRDSLTVPRDSLGAIRGSCRATEAWAAVRYEFYAAIFAFTPHGSRMSSQKLPPRANELGLSPKSSSTNRPQLSRRRMMLFLQNSVCWLGRRAVMDGEMYVILGLRLSTTAVSEREVKDSRETEVCS